MDPQPYRHRRPPRCARRRHDVGPGYQSRRRSLEERRHQAEDLNLIIVCTLTPDRALPSTACKVQANLHAVNAAAFDLEAACSGFAYGSIIASQFIENKMYKYVLVIGAEILTRVVNWNGPLVVCSLRRWRRCRCHRPRTGRLRHPRRCYGS